MILLSQIKTYFPPYLQEQPAFEKHLLKEYLQLMILDHLSTTPYIRKIVFIGGTNLRLVKGIDRFSEDLDFDCKNLTQEEFLEMTESIVRFLNRAGFRVETRDKENSKLSAFRSNIYFPELLFELGLSGHKEARFLIKVESEDQKINYKTKMVNIKGCGFFFSFPVPDDHVLCAMKIAAMLNRSKGRDFYDLIFLLSQTTPDYDFLSKKCDIHNLEELKKSIQKRLKSVNLKIKQRDFEHLLFNKSNSEKIHRFAEFVESL